MRGDLFSFTALNRLSPLLVAAVLLCPGKAWSQPAHPSDAVGPTEVGQPRRAVDGAIAGRHPGHIHVLIGGDTHFGESYQQESARNGGNSVLVEKGYDYSLANLSRLLRAVDFRILNLETPLTALRSSPLKGKNYIHYGDPAGTLEALGRFGPIAYSLANNHTLDQGAAGLEDTRAAIEAAGAHCFGAGRNLPEAEKPLIQKFRLGERSLTLAVFGGLEYTRRYDEQFHFYADAGRPGTARLDASSVAAVERTIHDLRQKEPNVFTIYFMHTMVNYRWKTSIQAANAQMLRRAGVDLVVGAGAHMMQEIERDGGQWVLFGIGNFVFNASGRYAQKKAPPFSLPVVIDFSLTDDHLRASLRAYPIVSDNTLTEYRPRFVTDAELGVVGTLLAQRGNWNPATLAAVKRGKDEIGNYIELTGSPQGDTSRAESSAPATAVRRAATAARRTVLTPATVTASAKSLPKLVRM